MMFELVPAVSSFFGQLYIPAPASDFTDWIETSPVEFNKELQDKNARTSSKMKPLIRVIKYWNAQNGYVFPSYELEQQLISYWYWGDKNLRDYFYSAFESLDLPWGSAQWRHHGSNNVAKCPITLEAVISRAHLRAPYGRGFTGSG
jgi:hypothetical protein